MSEAATAPWASLNASEGFYVTIRRDSRRGILLGPFSDHQAALDQVDAARELAIKHVDRMACFDEYGTMRLGRPAEGHPLHDRPLPAGRLNELWEKQHGAAVPE